CGRCVLHVVERLVSEAEHVDSLFAEQFEWSTLKVLRLSARETHGPVCSRLLLRSKGDIRYFVLIIHEEYSGIACGERRQPCLNKRSHLVRVVSAVLGSNDDGIVL